LKNETLAQKIENDRKDSARIAEINNLSENGNDSLVTLKNKL